ncbi:hypothetical protein [Sorangium sp. So ce388]|uniref:hypothetical protein n=1 Tax=Sorangium sp. So ce388 TaxID=3133309 RepID=UPI003F5C4F74
MAIRPDGDLKNELRPDLVAWQREEVTRYVVELIDGNMRPGCIDRGDQPEEVGRVLRDCTCMRALDRLDLTDVAGAETTDADHQASSSVV